MAEGKERSSLLDKLIPFIIIAAIGLAFAVGVLWQKVQTLEKGSTATAGTQEKVAPLAVENLKKFAEELKLNEKDFNKCLDEGKYADKVKNDLSYGTSLGVQGTPAFYINGKFLGGAYPYEYFKEIIDLELTGKGKTIKEYSEALQEANSEAGGKSFDITPKDINLGDAPVKGDANAKVVVVEFSDFECPYCARHFTQTYPKLMEDFVNTGKIRYAFKHYPLTFHASAQKASEAAECAKEQGKFWEMHDRLFTASSSTPAQ